MVKKKLKKEWFCDNCNKCLGRFKKNINYSAELQMVFCNDCWDELDDKYKDKSQKDK